MNSTGNSNTAGDTGNITDNNTGDNTNSYIEDIEPPTVSKVRSFKITPNKKSLKLKWKKVSGIKRYELQYSLKKNFANAKKISISKSKTSYTIKKLKSKKKYYVRIRAVKTYKDAGYVTQTVYGTWVTKSKKTK